MGRIQDFHAALKRLLRVSRMALTAEEFCTSGLDQEEGIQNHVAYQPHSLLHSTSWVSCCPAGDVAVALQTALFLQKQRLLVAVAIRSRFSHSDAIQAYPLKRLAEI